MNFEELRIKTYKTWTLYLNEYQCYLGRVCLVANRESAKDFIATTAEERGEFFQICEQVNETLKKLFAPDLMNYASLGNNVNHLHVHIIPRYEKERIFNGIKFIDIRWGSNYAPYDREFQLEAKDLFTIRDAISSQLLELDAEKATNILIREAQKNDSELAKSLMKEFWGGEPLLIRGKAFFPSELPGFLAFSGEKIAGFLFYTVEGNESEIIAFQTIEKFHGLGTQLLEKFQAKVRSLGITRVHLTTCNDNLDSLRFYQKRGFHICRIHLNTIEEARKNKPDIISVFGDYGIPIRDEIDLEMNIRG